MESIKSNIIFRKWWKLNKEVIDDHCKYFDEKYQSKTVRKLIAELAFKAGRDSKERNKNNNCKWFKGK